MKVLNLLCFILITGFSLPAYADLPEAFEITDGPTSPILDETITAAPIAAAPAAIVEETEAGKVAYNPIAGTPPCINSTCITPQTMANADGAFVQNSPVKTYIDLIKTPKTSSECQAPAQTGMTIYRQVVDEGNGKIVEIQDAFCVNQGCVYFGSTSNEKCELPG